MIETSVQYLNSAEALRSIESNPYWPKWNSPWWHMSVLFELGEARQIPQTAAAKMLAEIKRTHLPYFFKRDAPADKKPGQTAPCPCAFGNIYQILTAAGQDVDGALPWAREWFLKYQLPDGGLNCDESAYGSEPNASSLVGTIAPLEAILLTRAQWTAAETAFVDRGALCLLDRELRLGSASRHNAEERLDEADWLLPCFPRFYFYDVLRGLNFILSWAELRRQSFAYAKIERVVEHLRAHSADGQIRIGRQSFEGVQTRLESTGWARLPKGDASRFELLDRVSRVGEGSVPLTQQWQRAQQKLHQLRAQGLVR